MTTKFKYQLNDETVQVEVTSYMPFMPMSITGSGFGDCEMPQPEGIGFTITDSNGVWLMDEYDAPQKVFYDVLQIFKEKMA
jgi:hypothetical protein